MNEELITILVVDDEPAIRLGLAATIKRHGYSVVVADDGTDGLAKAGKYLPDLIISDVMMPNLGGFEMRMQMNNDPKLASIPFIFLTARTEAEDRVMGIRAGADDYVSKPFETEELLARIDAVLRRVRRERERGKEEAEQSAQGEMDKLRREILQNFRHELRTPMGNIVMALEMAVNNRYDDPAEQSEFIKIALSSVDRMESLVSDIILLSDIDQKDINTVRQMIDVNHHILGPVEKRLQRYQSKELEFIHDIQVQTPITAPRREFSHALVCLMDNAFRFSPQHGKVTLTVRSSGNGGAIIGVEDEGPGIPVELREKVFERFYQISQGDNREYQGLGVGLTVARAVFESLGGMVNIAESEKGCRVYVILPEPRPEDSVYG
jgi:signal transduction histidine kinase